MILIVGGTGVLGSATAEQLLAQGEAVRIITRFRRRSGSG
jgi:nucleoside-diphosphate-sugar epimerase